MHIPNYSSSLDYQWSSVGWDSEVVVPKLLVDPLIELMMLWLWKIFICGPQSVEPTSRLKEEYQMCLVHAAFLTVGRNPYITAVRSSLGSGNELMFALAVIHLLTVLRPVTSPMRNSSLFAAISSVYITLRAMGHNSIQFLCCGNRKL